MQSPVQRLAIAEALFTGLVGLLFAGEWAGLGPDGSTTAILLTTTLVVVVGLAAILPVLLLSAVRDIAKPEARTTIAQMTVVVAGAVLWLVLVIWLAFLYFSGALSHR